MLKVKLNKFICFGYFFCFAHTLFVQSILAVEVDWVGPQLNLTPFVDELPIPPSIHLTGQNLKMEATQLTHQFHRDLRPSQVWTL